MVGDNSTDKSPAFKLDDEVYDVMHDYRQKSSQKSSRTDSERKYPLDESRSEYYLDKHRNRKTKS